MSVHIDVSLRRRPSFLCPDGTFDVRALLEFVRREHATEVFLTDEESAAQATMSSTLVRVPKES